MENWLTVPSHCPVPPFLHRKVVSRYFFTVTEYGSRSWESAPFFHAFRMAFSSAEAAASSKITKQTQFTYKSIYFNHLADISEAKKVSVGRKTSPTAARS